MTSEAGADCDAQHSGVLRLELPLRETAIEEARLAVLAYLEPVGLSERLSNRIQVILEELLSNILRHGASVSSMTLEAAMAGEALRLTVLDDGKPFDPTHAPEPEKFTTLAAARTGGLGIPLVRRLASHFGYDRIDGCNRVTVSVLVSPD